MKLIAGLDLSCSMFSFILHPSSFILHPSHEICPDHSRRLCRRAAGVAWREDAASGGLAAGDGRRGEGGVVGRANHTPEALPAGSDMANLSLLGYDPITHYFPAGRRSRPPPKGSPWGRRLGRPLQPGDDRRPGDEVVHRRANLPPEAAELLSGSTAARQRAYSSFIPASVTAICSCTADRAGRPCFSKDTRTTPPHDLTDQSVLDDYPRGPGSDVLNQLMSESLSVFAGHPVNAARQAAGKPPATNVWLWGLGSTPHLQPFDQVYGVRGAMITAVDLLAAWQPCWAGSESTCRGHRIPRHRLRRQGPICRRSASGGRSDLRPRRGQRRGLARRQRGREDQGPGADRPPHRRSAVRGAEKLRRLPHPG